MVKDSELIFGGRELRHSRRLCGRFWGLAILQHEKLGNIPTEIGTVEYISVAVLPTRPRTVEEVSRWLHGCAALELPEGRTSLNLSVDIYWASVRDGEQMVITYSAGEILRRLNIRWL
jgi:hypothetical protein